LTSNTIYFFSHCDLLLVPFHASFLRVFSHIFFFPLSLCLDISICNCHNFAFRCTVFYCHSCYRKDIAISDHQNAFLIFNLHFPKCSISYSKSAVSNLLFMPYLHEYKYRNLSSQ
jgi:hypothetical protein